MPPPSVLHSGPCGDWELEGDETDGASGLESTLQERLVGIVNDHASTAAEIVFATTEIVLEWLEERDASWTWSDAGRDLERDLAEWQSEHGWRGPAALWLDALRRTWHMGRDTYPDRPLEVLSEELGLWLWSHESEAAAAAELEATLAELDDDSTESADLSRASTTAPAESGDTTVDSEGRVRPRERPWNGEPLGVGRRLVSRETLAEHAASAMDRGEIVLVTGYSHTVARALEIAWRAGKRPEVIVCEGLPYLDGRRMAQTLVTAGIVATLCYDLALFSALPRVDRVWLATESLGVESFVARVGTRALLEEAARLEVPVELLATSDKLMPGGRVRLPQWPERDTWLLWYDPAEGVRLATQCFEEVPLELVTRIVTEAGVESPAALSVRALRAPEAEPCATSAPQGQPCATDERGPLPTPPELSKSHAHASAREPSARAAHSMIDDGSHS